MIHENSRKYHGSPPTQTHTQTHTHTQIIDFRKIWKTYPTRCPKNTFPEAFLIKLSILNLISNGLNRVGISLLTWIVALL